MKNFLLLSIFLLAASNFFAQPIYTQADVDVCNSKFQLAVDKKLADKPINEIIIEIGKSFIGLDYEAFTLEKGEKETLVIHLTGLDCYTFLETSFVFSRCIKKGKTTFEDFQNEVTSIRYRDGKINEYPSRLHYFSDWIYDIDKRGIGKNITKEIGGRGYMKKIDFMTTHIDAYRQLKENSNFVEEIRNTERKISFRKNFYIPQDEIERIEDKIQSGDLIGITTNVEGLDIAHTGIAIRMDDGRIHFMHSPIAGKKIQITEKPLADYIKGNKKQTGIMVLRPN